MNSTLNVLRDPAVGNFAELMGGIGAVAALWFALREVRQARNQRAQEKKNQEMEVVEYRESQARAVGIHAESPSSFAAYFEVRGSINNAGRYPIEAVEIRASATTTDGAALAAVKSVLPSEARERLQDIFAASELDFHVTVGAPRTNDWVLVVLFTDTWGQRWGKVFRGDLLQIGRPTSPENIDTEI